VKLRKIIWREEKRVPVSVKTRTLGVNLGTCGCALGWRRTKKRMNGKPDWIFVPPLPANCGGDNVQDFAEHKEKRTR
jgi:hypothetical protein